MKNNPSDPTPHADTGTSVPPVTREKVRARTREIAFAAGRAPHQIRQSDYERAKRELTGTSDPDLQEQVLAAAENSRANLDGRPKRGRRKATACPRPSPP